MSSLFSARVHTSSGSRPPSRSMAISGKVAQYSPLCTVKRPMRSFMCTNAGSKLQGAKLVQAVMDCSASPAGCRTTLRTVFVIRRNREPMGHRRTLIVCRAQNRYQRSLAQREQAASARIGMGNPAFRAADHRGLRARFQDGGESSSQVGGVLCTRNDSTRGAVVPPTAAESISPTLVTRMTGVCAQSRRKASSSR